MRLNLLLLNLVALGLATNIAFADGYQIETNADASLIDYDRDSISKEESTNFSATYYFKKVELKNHPFVEAAFLEKNSNFTLGYHKSDVDSKYYTFDSEGGISSTPVQSSTRLTSADIEFYIPNSIFYIGANIEDEHIRMQYKDANQTIWETTWNPETTWSVRLGLTPVTGLLVWTELAKDQDFDEDWNINAKYVTDLGGNAINLEAGYIYAEASDIANLAADYYLDRSFSIGLLYDHYQDGSIDNAYGVRTRKFFTNNLALEAAYKKNDYADEYKLGISYRF